MKTNELERSPKERLAGGYDFGKHPANKLLSFLFESGQRPRKGGENPQQPVSHS